MKMTIEENNSIRIIVNCEHNNYVFTGNTWEEIRDDAMMSIAENSHLYEDEAFDDEEVDAASYVAALATGMIG